MMESSERLNETKQSSNYYTESTVFVAVGKLVKDSESVLSWAAKKFAGKKRICLLYVHQPAHLVTFFDGKFTTSKFKQRAVKAFHELDIQKIHKLISQYILVLSQMGVHADRMWMEMDNIEEGIVKLIVEHGIKWLVMGAAADKHYTKEMTELKSQKAIFVCEQAPVSCHIWFTCRGNLIYTREGPKNYPGADISLATESPDDVAIKESDHIKSDSPGANISSEPKSLHLNVVMKGAENVRLLAPALHTLSLNSNVSTEESESESELESESLESDGEIEAAEHVRVDVPGTDTLLLDSNEAAEESGNVKMDCMTDEHGSPPRLTFRERNSILRACSVDFGSYMEKQMVLSSPQICGTSYDCGHSEEKHLEFEGSTRMFDFHSSFDSSLFEGKMGGNARLRAPREIHARLKHAMLDAEHLKQTAFQESVKRWKAEENAMDAERKADAAQCKYAKEMKQRQEAEEALAKQKLECETLREEHEKYRRELPKVQDQCSSLENQIRESEITTKELEEKIISAVDLLISFRAKRDQLQMERDKAIQEVESLRRLKGQRNAALSSPQFSTFSLMEIGEATCSFDPSKKIGDGKYGSIYHGVLRHMEVAIRMLPNDGFQGQRVFEYKVEILSRVRHPNIVMLTGICPEARSIVYEYLERGSLEDHLACKGKNTPLSWQTRVHIAAQLCSALIFLHSNNPPIFHGNLKPTKVLLDANFTGKIGDTGIFHLIPKNQLPNTHQHSASVYTDPEFLQTGILTTDSDVYSFGIMLLRLLTGRPASGIVKDVKLALKRGNFESVLDFSAGEWPVNQAKTLAWMALQCCDRDPSKRPDLASEVWRVVEPLRKSCDAQPSYLQKKENCRPPPHFLCPIYKEVMKEPCTAADGYTYEEEAIRGWLDSGHTTSPMTNLKLSTCDLIPNHALQYAIQEWLQRS